jgi:predicted secreted protein
MAIAAHGTKIYCKSSSAAPSASDEVKGLNDFSASSSKTMLDVTDFKDSAGVKLKLAGLEDGSFSLSGDLESGDAPQALIRSSFDSGATVYLTLHWDPTAPALSKGYQFPCIVESYEVKGSVDGKTEFSASLQLNGAKTAV